MSWDSAFGQSLLGTKSEGQGQGQGQGAQEAAEAFGSHYDYAAAEYVESSAPRTTSKWEELQPMAAGTGFAQVQDPTQMEIPTCSALRIRREQNGRDFVNSRLWDNFHATPPTQTSSDSLKTSSEPKYMDMNPVGSRKATGQFRHQLEYMPNNALPPTKNSTNPFLQRMDAEGSDARNIVREFRDAVTEDNRERDVESAKRLAERQFADRWLPPQVAEEAAALQAYELLRPKQYFET
jgi:hypothetical protein